MERLIAGFESIVTNRGISSVLFFVSMIGAVILTYFIPTLNAVYTFPLIFGSLLVRRFIFHIPISLLITLEKVFLTQSAQASIQLILFNWFNYLCLMTAISSILNLRISESERIIHFTVAATKMIEARDPYTANHSDNVARYSRLIAEQLGLSKRQCEKIHLGGLLHDIGKIGISETVLKKPSRLSEQEYEHVKQHTTIGYGILEHSVIFRRNGVLSMVRHHHERFDGLGYPDNLEGEKIPLESRIIAVADSFDAMTSQRVYRKDVSFEVAVQELIEGKGTQFDPRIVDAFLAVLDKEGTHILQPKPPT